MTRIPAAVLILALLAPASACNGDTDADAARIQADRDTVNESALDGLSRTQIERQAEPMSPEQAEQLGVIDSTIHLEDPTVDMDTVLPVNVPRPSAEP